MTDLTHIESALEYRESTHSDIHDSLLDSFEPNSVKVRDIMSDTRFP